MPSLGRVIIGASAPEAPPSFSGLPVRRYDRTGLAAELGPAFALERFREETHVTPSGAEQRYLYCLFRKTGSRA